MDVTSSTPKKPKKVVNKAEDLAADLLFFEEETIRNFPARWQEFKLDQAKNVTRFLEDATKAAHEAQYKLAPGRCFSVGIQRGDTIRVLKDMGFSITADDYYQGISWESAITGKALELREIADKECAPQEIRNLRTLIGENLVNRLNPGPMVAHLKTDLAREAFQLVCVRLPQIIVMDRGSFTVTFRIQHE